jgi:hypothetical protein
MNAIRMISIGIDRSPLRLIDAIMLDLGLHRFDLDQMRARTS